MSGAGIQGHCAPGFEPVRDAFAANLAEQDEIGASVAVVVRGELAVNLWAGWADLARTRPWREDTLTNVWSTTKAMTSLAAQILIDRGELDPDAPVARYWPDFAAAGKGEIPVRWVMCHQSGLSGLSTPITVQDTFDWEKMTSLLAAQEPLWEPGTASGYHAMTFGFLVGELIRRISGQRPGNFFAAEVAGPLGADFHIGVPDSEFGRCSELQGVRMSDDEQAEIAQAFANMHPAAVAAMTNPAVTGDEANDPAWRRAELLAANGHGTAAALATIMGTLVDGSQRLISEKTLRRACVGHGIHTDLVLGIPVQFGLGYGVTGELYLYGRSESSFGHDGFGGSAVCADPEQGLAWAYVMNRMGMSLTGDPRKMALMDGIYRSLGVDQTAG
jgi:CubicO group peptidase (beta-lactamase class C family)